MKLLKTLGILLLAFGWQDQAQAAIINLGSLSFDEFIPAAAGPGVHAFNVANLTGSF